MPYARNYYGELGDIYGSGGTAYCIVPLGDPRFENAARTTVTTTGAGGLDGLVFTYNEARTAFDLLMPTQGRGEIPRQPLNGSDEEADTPDAAIWTRDDSGATPWSWTALVNMVDVGTILSKWETTGGNREWRIEIASDKLTWALYDDVNDIEVFGQSDTVLLNGRTYSVGGTYDGGGGATAINGMNFYENGVLASKGTSNNGAYVSMTDLAGVVELGKRDGTIVFFNGTMYGGPCGPCITHRVLSAQDMRAIAIIQQEALTDLPLIQKIRGMR